MKKKCAENSAKKPEFPQRKRANKFWERTASGIRKSTTTIGGRIHGELSSLIKGRAKMLVYCLNM